MKLHNLGPIKPPAPKPSSLRKTNTYATITAFKVLMTTIEKKPMTQPEIVELTGLVNSTVSRWLRFLNQSPSMVYIESWRRTSSRGNPSAVWAAGYGRENCPKPPPLTMSQYNKRWRASKAREGQIIQTEKGIIHVCN